MAKSRRDVSRLPPGQQLAAPDKWPVVGPKRPSNPPQPWRVAVAGLVRRPQSWSLSQLRALPQTERLVDVHCVTRWSKLDMRFGGVLLARLLADAEPTDQARYVSFVAAGEPPHTTSLPLADAIQLGVLVALDVDGHPLPPEHGGPVRIVTPERYFYKSLKWLARIDLLAEDRLGSWEAGAGYHNRADPWREERFADARPPRAVTEPGLARRDIRRRQWLGLQAAGRRLEGLRAEQAVLRNADFRRAVLRDARFDRANLSGARFGDADLRGASFRNADLEGADFSGADLRGVDFRGASLLGASFVRPRGARQAAARLDPTTLLDPNQLASLTPDQASAALRALERPGEQRSDASP